MKALLLSLLKLKIGFVKKKVFAFVILALLFEGTSVGFVDVEESVSKSLFLDLLNLLVFDFLGCI